MLKETIMAVPVLTTEHDDTWRGCMLGKYAKEAYSRRNKRVKSALGLIHSENCGAMYTWAISALSIFLPSLMTVLGNLDLFFKNHG